MKKQIKIISLIAIIALVISLGAVGCARNPARPNTPYNTQLNRNMNFTGDRTDMNRDLDNNLNNRNITDNNINNRDIVTSDRADKIANKVSDLKEVNRATVVISGNTALVGVNIADNIEGNMTNNLKEKIKDTVKATDKNIRNVSVTANADLYKRIDNIGQDIRNGKPLSGFAAEIEEILRRINPLTR